MTLDLEKLLQAFGADEPSGEDLEYDPDFISLELVAMPKEEHQVGDTVIAGEEPDYREVKKGALKVLERSHDLRAAVFYANATLRTDGISGFAEALGYVRGCLEQHWATCHPQLDADDNDDPTARVNAVKGLIDNETILRGLRAVPLAESRVMGRFGLREIQIARGEAPAGPDDAGLDATKIASALSDTPQEALRAHFEAVKAAREHVKAIQAVFDDKLGAMGPDLNPLAKPLFQMEKVLSEHVHPDQDEPEAEGAAETPAEGGEGDGGAAAGDGAAAAAPATGAAGAVKGVGTIASRKDVLTAIDRICEYYARNEPSSPVPVLLKRTKKLVVADFESIMRDLAPSGLDQWKLIKGTGDEEA